VEETKGSKKNKQKKWRRRRSLEKQQQIPMQPNKVPSSIGPLQVYSIYIYVVAYFFLSIKQGFIFNSFFG